jgi:hypothetical protein
VSGVVVGTAVPSNLIPTNQTASFSDGANNKRAQLTSMPRATLMPRAPNPVPLVSQFLGGILATSGISGVVYSLSVS